MRAGLYSRVSTTEQAEEGYSIEAQLEAMRRYCKAEGWSVVAEYKDEGISGTTGDRPGLQEALADCEARKIDALLTHQLDRFYRNLRLQLETMERLERWGIVYVSVAENLDFSAPHGKLVASMMGSVNEYFIDNMRREVRKGKRSKAQSGLSNASVPAYGYTREGHQDIVDPEAADAVILAYERYASGEYTDQQIANLLRRKGYQPPGWKVKRWTRGVVRYILMNQHYTGMVRHGDEWYPGQHEPIISRELWEQAQAARRQRTSGAKGGRHTSRVYLLHYLAHCYHCGQPLHMAPSHSRFYYRDGANLRGIDCPAAGRSVPMAVIDNQVAGLITRVELPDDWRERLQELAENQEKREDTKGKRRYLEGKLRRLRELYLDGDFDKTEYNRRKAELRAQLDALTVPEQPAIEEAGETLEELGAVWVAAPLRIQRDMLQVIFEAVYVDVLAQRLVCVKPYPQFAPLFRMDGLREEEGCFYVREEDQEAGPAG